MALPVEMPSEAETSYHYLAFDLCLSLPFPAMQLTPAPPDSPVDIHVSLGATPPSLPTLHHASRDESTATEIQISSQGEMLWTTRRARFWASDGTRIVVEPLVKLKPASLRHFVLYVCLSTLLNQRGLLALHANAVVGSQGAIVVTGRSGAGKSTLLAALLARGLPMLADDMTVLKTVSPAPPPHARPTVLPGYPSYRLCSDTLTQLTPVADRIVALGGERNKHLLFAPKENVYATPVPLHALYILNPQPQEQVRMRRVEGLQAFQLVQESCYDPTARLLLPHALQQIQQVTQSCAVYQIDRPANRWTIDELTDLLLAPQNELAPKREDPQPHHASNG